MILTLIEFQRLLATHGLGDELTIALKKDFDFYSPRGEVSMLGPIRLIWYFLGPWPAIPTSPD